MKRIILRIRPLETMEDLDLNLIYKRAAMFSDGELVIQDTRLSDAPYISIIVILQSIGPEVVAQLKEVFSNLPRMRVQVWSRSNPEVLLDSVNLETLEEIAEQ